MNIQDQGSFDCHGCLETFMSEKERDDHESVCVFGLPAIKPKRKTYSNDDLVAEAKKAYKTDGCLVCDVCECIFYTRQGLTGHKRTHLQPGIPQFICKYCGIRYHVKRSLNRHVRIKHADDIINPHICDQCDRKFVTHAGLIQHKCKK